VYVVAAVGRADRFFCLLYVKGVGIFLIFSHREHLYFGRFRILLYHNRTLLSIMLWYNYSTIVSNSYNNTKILLKQVRRGELLKYTV